MMSTTKTTNSPMKKSEQHGKKPSAQRGNQVHGKRDIPALCEGVLEGMAEGLSTVKACAAVGIAFSTFLDRCAADQAFAERYARAREVLLERHADEIIDLADQARMGEITTTKADGGIEVKQADMVERSRLQIESRKWLLARLMPKKYGDRQKVEHEGGVSLTVITGVPE